MSEQDATIAPAPQQSEPQSFDDLFKAPATQSFDDLFKPRATSMLPEPPLSLDADQWKTYLNEAPVGRIISAFGNAFTGPGFSEEATEKMRELGIFNDVSKAQQEHTDSFAQGIVRPIITGARTLAEGIARPFIGGLDTIQRAIEGTENAVAETGRVLEEPGFVQIPGAGQLGSDIAGMIEAVTTFGHLVPENVPRLPHDIAEPRAGAVIGEGEQGYFDTKAPTDEELQARTAAAAQVMPEAAPVEAAAPEAPSEPTPTVHDIARQAEPDLFREYDALQARRDTFSRWLRELPETTRANIEAKPPEQLRTIDDQIAATRRKLENAGARRRGDFEEQLDALHDQRADLMDDLVRNHPDVAQVRQALQETDYRMRDLAPDVSAAYREAELRAPQMEEVGAELPPAVDVGEEITPFPSENNEIVPEMPAKEIGTAEPQVLENIEPRNMEPPGVDVEPKLRATVDQLKQIVIDVTQKLTAAGRPDEEARAAAQIVAAYYDTRAQRFGGKLGTAQEMYAREAPQIRAGRQRASRAVEYAQNKEGFTNSIDDVLEAATQNRNPKANTILAHVSDWLTEKAKAAGLNLSGFTHAIDATAVRHIRNRHFDPKVEESRGQVPLTDNDIRQIPSVLEAPDKLVLGAKNNRGQPVVGYVKRMPDGATLYLEEVRSGRRELSAHTMWKYPPGMAADQLDRVLSNALGGRGATLNIVDVEPGSSALRYATELEQGKRGKINILDDGRKIITLFRDADASTFIHETGHAWLEDLLADAKRPEAPEDLKHDAETVRKWLGIEEGARPRSGQHEKFARGFERYMMEGVAPNHALAGVFAKFKDWLTKIYQTVERLRSPINDDIRDVFDRLLSRNPEHVTIAPEIERPGGMADIHEAQAEHTPPAEAAPVLDKQRTEFKTDARSNAPEIVPEREPEPAGESGRSAPQREGSDRGVDEAQPQPGTASDVQESGAVGAGAGEAGAEGAPTPTESGAGKPAGSQGAGLPDESKWPPDAGTADPELIDKAGNIRLDNLNQPDDVDDALRQIAREQNNFEADRFGPEGRQLHDQILAARQLTARAMQEMAAARVRAAHIDSSLEDVMAYQVAANRLTMIARRLATLTHNWGLAGQAFRSLNGLPESTKMLTMAQLAERTKGMTFNQLKQEAQLGLKLDTPAQQMKFINDLRKSDWDKARSMIIEYFVNNLISGPITHMAYTIGNETANLFRAGIEGPIAAAISAVRGREIGERIYAGEAKALIYSHTKGAADGWTAAAKAWKTGIAEALPGELEALSPAERERFEANRIPNTGAIPGKFGEAIRLPSHGVAAIHSFGRAVGAAQELWRLAYRSASDAGLEGQAFDRHVANFIDNPPEGTLEKVNEAATRGVLMQRAQYGTAFYHLKQLTEKNLAAKLVAPFMQIGANLLHEAFLERTPLGLINKDIRDNLMGRNGAIAQDMQMGKMVAGITLSTAIMGLTLNGLVSGGGPSDPKERRVLMATGWQPYSIKIGERWMPFRKYMGPLGLLVAGAADTAEIGQQISEGDLLKAAASFVGGFSEVVADESWFRGVSNFINAARNYDKPEGERYLRDLATDFIPYSIGLSQVARAVDPYSRQVRTFVDSVKGHIPGVSETLFPRRDIIGEPIPGRLMTSPSEIRNEPVLDAMLKAEYYPATLGRKIRGVDLTDQQYDDFQRIAGRMAKVTIRSMVDQSDWGNLPLNLRHKMIEDAFTHARERARATVIAQSIGTDHDIAKAALSAKVKRLSDMQ